MSKHPVYADGVSKVSVYDPSAIEEDEPRRRFLVTLGKTWGVKDLEGRETHAALDPQEVAKVLGAIPAKDFEDLEDWKAYLRMTAFLMRYGS